MCHLFTFGFCRFCQSWCTGRTMPAGTSDGGEAAPAPEADAQASAGEPPPLSATGGSARPGGGALLWRGGVSGKSEGTSAHRGPPADPSEGLRHLSRNCLNTL